jgi:hypothetical protein
MSVVFNLSLPEWLLRAVLWNPNVEVYSSPEKVLGVSEAWIYSLMAVAVLVTSLMALTKWAAKRSTGGIPRPMIWPLPKTLMFVFLGLILIVPIASLLCYFNLDYREFIGLPGLVKGVVFISWLTYLVLMGLLHLLIWRRDLYLKKA